jgi:FtsZ-binding cell division protein ZapB
MTEKESIINSLEEKIKKLITLHASLRSENENFSSENNDLKSAIVNKNNELKDLQSRYEQLKLAKLLATGSEDVHEAKLKVNKIVREIDKCIALLNK